MTLTHQPEAPSRSSICTRPTVRYPRCAFCLCNLSPTWLLFTILPAPVPGQTSQCHWGKILSTALPACRAWSLPTILHPVTRETVLV